MSSDATCISSAPTKLQLVQLLHEWWSGAIRKPDAAWGQLDEEGQHDEKEESFQVQMRCKVSCSGSLCQYGTGFIITFFLRDNPFHLLSPFHVWHTFFFSLFHCSLVNQEFGPSPWNQSPPAFLLFTAMKHCHQNGAEIYQQKDINLVFSLAAPFMVSILAYLLSDFFFFFFNMNVVLLSFQDKAQIK